MIELSMSFPQDKVAELNRQIGRLIEVSGKLPEASVKRAMFFVLKSLSATTKVAKKQRKVERADFIQKRRKRSERNEGGLFKVQVYNRKTGSEETRIFSADSLQEAKQKRIAQVYYAGLAKRSWGWAMRDLFGTAGDEVGFKRKPGMVETQTSKSTIDYSIKVSDNLRYIENSFKSKGKATIENLLTRASNQIRKDVERALEGSNAWARS
jgi:hypothetical protein